MADYSKYQKLFLPLWT